MNDILSLILSADSMGFMGPKGKLPGCMIIVLYLLGQ